MHGAAGGELLEELLVPCRQGAEKRAMEAAAAYGSACGFSAARCADIGTAVSEACLNAIEHGNRGCAAPIRVRFRRSRGKLEVDVADGGSGFDPASIPDRIVIPEAPRSGRIRGLGLFLIRRLVDGLETIPEGDGAALRLCFMLPDHVHPGGEG